jgi:hypothetical protein
MKSEIIDEGPEFNLNGSKDDTVEKKSDIS